jgi:predicted transcriptional regulator
MQILLSIKPQFADKIFSGTKRFEFRKAIHKNRGVTTVLVYATKPVGKIVGEFTVSRVHNDSPERLWRITKGHSGITKRFFDEYFHGRVQGFAIEVGITTLYKMPLEIRDVIPGGYPPQTFVYIRKPLRSSASRIGLASKRKI